MRLSYTTLMRFPYPTLMRLSYTTLMRLSYTTLMRLPYTTLMRLPYTTLMRLSYTHAPHTHAGHTHTGTVFQFVNFIYMFHNDSITAKTIIYRRYHIEKLKLRIIKRSLPLWTSIIVMTFTFSICQFCFSYFICRARLSFN